MVDVVLNVVTPNVARGQNLDCVQLTDNRFFFVYFDSSTPFAAIIDFTDFSTSDAYTITRSASLGVGTFTVTSAGIKIERFTSDWVLVTIGRNVYLVNVTATDFSVTAQSLNILGYGNDLSLVNGATNNNYNPLNKHIDTIRVDDDTIYVLEYNSNTTSAQGVSYRAIIRNGSAISSITVRSISATSTRPTFGFRGKMVKLTNPFNSQEQVFMAHGQNDSTGMSPYSRINEMFTSSNPILRLNTTMDNALLFLENTNQIVSRASTISARYFNLGLSGGPTVLTTNLIPDEGRIGAVVNSTQVYDTLKLDDNYYLLATYDTSISTPLRYQAGYIMYKICSDTYHQSINNIAEGFNYPNITTGNNDLGLIWSGRDSFKVFGNTAVFFGYPTTGTGTLTFPIKRVTAS